VSGGSEEFTGRKRIFVVWVKRIGAMRSGYRTKSFTQWEPIACLTRGAATKAIARARQQGCMAFVRAYQKSRKRTSQDSATETAAEPE
jgi:hypothetical protein